MTPLQQYELFIQSGKIKPDPAQRQVIVHLDKLYTQLCAQRRFWPHLYQRILHKLHLSHQGIPGLYLWGGVGVGKTLLMDLFFHCLPFKQKTRLHFHRFMYFVHQSLQLHQGVKNPLAKIAHDFARHSKVLCFDEFYVSDIGDAMVLAKLFQYLFANGVTLVATSNLKPDELYKNGLQRERFLPTIKLIYAHTQVIAAEVNTDYRLQYLAQSGLYYFPLDENTKNHLTNDFYKLASDEGIANKILTITDRMLMTQRCAQNVVWFAFADLCESARSALDYIEIARSFPTVLLSGVKDMNAKNEDAARRFISLVDEFYERNVTLILSAEVPMTSLYQGQRYTFEFQRTLSRLTEMQSAAYLAKPHLP